jgi:hypothetical protein
LLICALLAMAVRLFAKITSVTLCSFA